MSVGTAVRAAGTCPADIQSQIEAYIANGPTARSTWAMTVQPVQASNPPSLIDINSQRVFTVASNTKLLTYSAVLLTMNVSSSFETLFWLNNASNELCVQAVGDPSITTEDLVEAAASMSAAGVTHIAQLSVYDGLFTLASIAPATWEVSDMWDESQISSALVNEGMVSLSLVAGASSVVSVSFAAPGDAAALPVDVSNVVVSPDGQVGNVEAYFLQGSTTLSLAGVVPPFSTSNLTVPTLQPALQFASQLGAALTGVGIGVGGVQVSSQPCACALAPSTCAPAVARVRSAPLVDLIQAALLASDNTVTEAFLRQLGVASVGPYSSADVAQAGLAVVANTLPAMLGVSSEAFVQVDGCGVSRQNLISPQALAQVLQGMAAIDTAFTGGVRLADLLPVAGVSGTLSDRYVGTIGAGRVIAKTGTLDNVNALSGYINRTGLAGLGLPEAPLLFSIVNVGSLLNATAGRDQIDAIVLKLFALDASAACAAAGSQGAKRGFGVASVIGIAFASLAVGMALAFGAAALYLSRVPRSMSGYQAINNA